MHDMLMIRFLVTLLVAGNLFLGYTHWESHRLYEAQTEELNRCNSEYQKLVDYHKKRGVENPFIECMGYKARDECLEQTMVSCIGDIDSHRNLDSYSRNLKLCQFMGEQAVKMELEMKILEPERGEQ